MTPLTAVIVDDEKHSLETTALLIGRFCPNLEVLAQFQDPIASIPQINALQPQLLFLDISMPEMNGFELLETLHWKGAQVIFTTAYDAHALEAFRYGALHYLVKPIVGSELVAAVKRAEERLQASEELADMGGVSKALGRKIPVSSLKGVEFIPVDDILHCESASNYTVLHLDSRQVTVSKTLKEVERQLAEEPQFIRVHNSHLVNAHSIARYIRGEGGTVVLTNGAEIAVSRSRKPELMLVLGIQ